MKFSEVGRGRLGHGHFVNTCDVDARSVTLLGVLGAFSHGLARTPPRRRTEEVILVQA